MKKYILAAFLAACLPAYAANITVSADVDDFMQSTNYAQMKSKLSLTIGTDVQAYDAELAAFASLTNTADQFPYFTGSGMATTTVTSAARSVLDDTTVDAMLATLGGTAPTGTGAIARAVSPTFTNGTLFSGGILLNGDTSGSVAIQSKDIAGSWNLTLPNDVGSASQLFMTDGTGDTSWSFVKEASLDATNAPTDNYILSYDAGSGGFTWVQDDTGSGSFGETSLAGLANSQTLWDGASASRTLTISLSGASDSVFTFTDGIVNLSTGDLQIAGSGVLVDSDIGSTVQGYNANTSILGSTIDVTSEITGTLPVANGGTGITSFGSGVSTWLGTPSSSNFAATVTGETGSGALVFGTSPGFTTAANPVSNDGAALGTSSLGWSDLFLASGGTLNFANTDWVATHSTGVLTVGAGDLRVSTAGTNSASVVTVGGTQTLTNKTLTAPAFSGTLTGTYTLGGTPTFPSTAVTAGSYTAANITVGADGRITAAANGSSGAGDVTAASAFGTDNVLVRSDGASKGVQSTGISVDDSDNVSGVNIITADTTNVTGSFSIVGVPVTSTAAELNILDGVTATAVELNYVDGVTSNIQNQLDNKASDSYARIGSFGTPITSTPYALTTIGPRQTIFYGMTGTVILPAATPSTGTEILVYNTGAFTVTVAPNGSDVIVRDGTAQAAGTSFTLASGAGNYVRLLSDATRWITLDRVGTLSGGVADTTAPTIDSININEDTVVVVFDEPVYQGSAYNDDQWTVDMSTTGTGIGLAYTSGDGTDTWTFTSLSPAVEGETVTLDFDGTADGAEDSAGNDLSAVSGGSVTNDTAAVPITYVLDEDFEGSTAGWTATTGTGGVADLAYATPLSGTYSARVMEASGDANLKWEFGAGYNTLEGSFEFMTPSSSGSNATARELFRIENTGGTTIGGVRITSSSSGTAFALLPKFVSTNGIATSATFGLSTKVYVWWAWDNVTDEMTVWWDTVNVKPTGDSTKYTTVTGTTTAAAAKIYLFSDVPNMNHVFDEVKVWEP